MKNWLQLVIVTILFVAPVLAEDVTARTSYGKLGGFTTSTKSSDAVKSTANVFLGVPYAIPAMDAIRFNQKTVGPEKWKDVYDATRFAASCVPLTKTFMVHKDRQYDEDCLYLNIIAPSWKKVDQPNGFPVMVFFHAGGFAIGDTNDFGYDFFAEHYVTRDVIIVTVQYRLGTLGFLAFDEEKEMSGNYGLWDALKALQYVHDEIENFGGDPDQVTIFGHSAGAAIVGHLALSSYVDGLFQNVIQMSGSPFAEWACSKRIDAGHAIVYAVGCNRAIKKQRNLCMNQKDVGELLDAVEKIGYYRRNSLNPFIFAPHIDNDFLKNDLLVSIREAQRKPPTLIGVADAEGLLFTIGASFRALSDLYVTPEDYDHFDESHFIDAIDALLANAKSTNSVAAAEELRRRIVDFYIRRADEHAPPLTFGEGDKTHFYLRQYTKVISDVMFLVPALIDTQEKAAAGWPVYLYRFGYVNKDTIEDSQKSIYISNTHGGEYPYLFGLRYDTKPILFNKDDIKFQKNFIDTLVQFAITGNPSTTVPWPSVAGDGIETLPHVELAPNLIVRNNIPFFTETLAFWLKIRADFGDIPEISSFPIRHRSTKLRNNDAL